MGAWTDSLNTVYAKPENHFLAALRHLATALEYDARVGVPGRMLFHSQSAAAHIVAWRRSLPDQGTRKPDRLPRLSDRGLLRCAVQDLMFADGAPTAQSNLLRSAEADLRTLWKRHRP